MFFTRHERTLNTDVGSGLGSLMLPPTRKKVAKKKKLAEKCSYLGNEHKVQGSIK